MLSTLAIAPARDEASPCTLSFRDVSTAQAGDTGLTEIRAAMNNHGGPISALADLLRLEHKPGHE